MQNAAPSSASLHRLMMRVPKSATGNERWGPGQDININVVGMLKRRARAATLVGVNSPLTRTYNKPPVRDRTNSGIVRKKRNGALVMSEKRGATKKAENQTHQVDCDFGECFIKN